MAFAPYLPVADIILLYIGLYSPVSRLFSPYLNYNIMHLTVTTGITFLIFSDKMPSCFLFA